MPSDFEIEHIRHFLVAHLRPAALSDLELTAQRLEQKLKVYRRAYEALKDIDSALGGCPADDLNGTVFVDASDYESMLQDIHMIREMGVDAGLEPASTLPSDRKD